MYIYTFTTALITYETMEKLTRANLVTKQKSYNQRFTKGEYINSNKIRTILKKYRGISSWADNPAMSFIYSNCVTLTVRNELNVNSSEIMF